jgi:rhamnosyltransferase subunit B
MAPGLDEVRARLGLAPARQIMGQWLHSPERVICAWPDWFAPPQADWPPQAVTAGFVRWPAPPGHGLDAALQAFLAAGSAPVGFTPGSAMAQGRDFFQRALQACAALGLRAVLVSPFTDQWPTPLPAWAHAVPYVPYDLLAPRLRALVHHGGIGTCVQGLAAGIPQGVLPFAHDQFDNASRLVRLGVALTWSPAASLRTWVRQLERLSREPVLASSATGLAARMACDGAAPERVADWIEALAPAGKLPSALQLEPHPAPCLAAS